MSAADIIRAIGRDKAVILSRQLGGKFVYIPQEPAPDNAISMALGTDTLAQIIKTLGSGTLYIPVGIYKSQRDARINELIAKGASAKRIARALHIAERTVRHVSRFERLEQTLTRQANDRPGQQPTR